MKSPLVNPEVPNPIHGFHEVPRGSSWILWISASWSFIHGFYEVTQFFFQKYYGPSPSWIPWTCWSLFMDFMKSPIFSFKSTMGPPLHGFHELAGPLFMDFLKSTIFMVLLKSCRLLSSGFSWSSTGPPSWISWRPTRFISNKGFSWSTSNLTKLMNFIKPPSVPCSWVSRSLNSWCWLSSFNLFEKSFRKE